jgi:hypothetical protein
MLWRYFASDSSPHIIPLPLSLLSPYPDGIHVMSAPELQPRHCLLSFLYVIILLSQRRWLRQSRVTYSCIASHAQLLGNMYYYCPLGLLGFWAFGASVMAMIQSTSGLKLFTSAFCGRSSLTALLDDFDDFPYLLHERKSRLLAYAYLR